MGVEAILVLLLVITPGLIADWAYRFLLWRPDPDETGRSTRGLIMSALGLLVLLFAADVSRGYVPAPPYLVSEWWSTQWTTRAFPLFVLRPLRTLSTVRKRRFRSTSDQRNQSASLSHRTPISPSTRTDIQSMSLPSQARSSASYCSSVRMISWRESPLGGSDQPDGVSPRDLK